MEVRVGSLLQSLGPQELGLELVFSGLSASNLTQSATLLALGVRFVLLSCC